MSGFAVGWPELDRSPVLIFLFDADTDHGRFLRLDTLDVASKGARHRTIKFPLDNVIDRENLETMVCQLQSARCK